MYGGLLTEGKVNNVLVNTALRLSIHCLFSMNYICVINESCYLDNHIKDSSKYDGVIIFSRLFCCVLPLFVQRYLTEIDICILFYYTKNGSLISSNSLKTVSYTA